LPTPKRQGGALESRTPSTLSSAGASPFAALILLFGLLLAPGALRAQDSLGLPEEKFVAGEALTLQVALDTLAFLNGGYAIDSTGYTDLPVLGRLFVAGRTRDDFEKYLAEKLSNYLKDTHIKAVPAIRLTWLGYWVKAGQYYVSPNTSVWEAVKQAGGIAGERNLDKLTVRRGEKFIELHVLDDYSRGSSLAKAGLRSGDIVIIPVPRDNAGFWYWFRETVTLTAQVAAILTSAMSAYIIYLNLEKQ
jgi:protein involved in polysaccharide export with SLBB domain